MAQTELSSLSVFFPAYNDARSLPKLISLTFDTAQRLTQDFEVIVVNDGSQDNTDQVMAELIARFGPRLKMVRHTVNQGYGGALKSGFRAAAKDYVFYTDGDGQYDVTELPRLVEALGPGIGLANGYKVSRSDVFYRIWIGKLYLWFVRLMFGLRVRDVDCDFRLIKRSFVERISLDSTSGAICVELVRKLQDAGCRVADVPVSHLPRLHGESQFFRPLNVVKSLGQLGALYFRLLTYKKPETAEALAARTPGPS